jgi:hypothetical protein
MINDVSTAGFAFDAVADTAIRSFSALLSGSGTRVTLTSWLRPHKSYIDELVRRLPPLAIEIGAQAIELDVESNWRTGTVQGFENRAEAAAYFFEALRRAAGRMEVAVTCEVDPMSDASMIPMLRGADIVVPQAYSTFGTTTSHAVGGVYGPRGIQGRAVQRLAEALAAPGRPILMGLAAYGRHQWPSVSPDLIMRMELEQTLNLRTTSSSIGGVRYWSWKQIAGLDARGGSPANPYAAKFFRHSVRGPGAAAAWPGPARQPPSASVSLQAATPPATTTPSVRPVQARTSTEWIEPERIDAPAPSAKSRSGFAAAPARTPSSSTSTRTLQSVRVDLPYTRQVIHAAKIYDPQRDATSLRAVNRAGTAVDLSALTQSEMRARIARHRQVHPVLARAISRVASDERVPIFAWIFHEHELALKATRGGTTPLLVASREATDNEPEADAGLQQEPARDGYIESLRASVSTALDAARARFREHGVEVSGDLGIVPVLMAEATREQVAALSILPEVTGLYLHETRGVPDLSNSIADAHASTAHSSGFKGADIRVAVWEATPADTASLAIEETFDAAVASSQAAGDRTHAQLVTAVIKNTQSAGSKGFAPDCKVYSANKYSTDALAWAVQTKHCTVVNQSFHFDSEETDSGLSALDLIVDYLVVHPPFPMIVQAAGNDPAPAVEYVNHKGFNSTRVGNHVDGASAMHDMSVFRNPASTHGDRELPDLSANGTTVIATGLTESGTSFSSPAVAGTSAVLQSVDATLKTWPEGCRAILLASANPNISGGTWSQAAGSTADGIDGSGALNTGEAVRIARVRAGRNSAAAQRGWDVGRLSSVDLRDNGTSTFAYSIRVPNNGPRRLKAALAWCSKITYTTDSSVTPPVRVTESKLSADLDLYVYRGSTLVAHSSTFDNSFEIVEFDAAAGEVYELRIKRFSGMDWVWFGIAWSVQ